MVIENISAIKPMFSAAGWYLGRSYDHGLPYARDSVEYWADKAQAEAALQSGQWTKRGV